VTAENPGATNSQATARHVLPPQFATSDDSGHAALIRFLNVAQPVRSSKPADRHRRTTDSAALLTDLASFAVGPLLHRRVAPHGFMDAQVTTTAAPPPVGAQAQSAGNHGSHSPVVRWLIAHRVIAITCTLALLIITAAIWNNLRAGAATTYVTLPVTRGTVAPYVTATGTVNAVVTVQVGTYVSGVIQELRCDFNTQVRKKQVCAKIDPRPYQTVVDQDIANLATARAQLDKDQASLQLAKLTDERDRELLRLDSIAREISDTATSTYRQALSQVALDKASISEREAALKAAQVNLEYTDIVSPVDGTVVSRNVTQGQTVAASFQTPTLFVIAADLTKMQVDASVSESDIGAIAVGNLSSFTVEAYPDRVFSGRILQVRQAPQTVQNVVTYDAVVEAANGDLLLKPGMTAAVRIIIGSHENVVRIPQQALRYRPVAGPEPALANSASPQVWLLRDGKPLPVSVRTGLNDETYVEIVQGDLKADDRVIVAERSAADTASSPAPGQIAPRAPRL
jgi:HlyD family secretion protein